MRRCVLFFIPVIIVLVVTIEMPLFYGCCGTPWSWAVNGHLGPRLASAWRDAVPCGQGVCAEPTLAPDITLVTGQPGVLDRPVALAAVDDGLVVVRTYSDPSGYWTLVDRLDWNLVSVWSLTLEGEGGPLAVSSNHILVCTTIHDVPTNHTPTDVMVTCLNLDGVRYWETKTDLGGAEKVLDVCALPEGGFAIAVRSVAPSGTSLLYVSRLTEGGGYRITTILSGVFTGCELVPDLSSNLLYAANRTCLTALSVDGTVAWEHQEEISHVVSLQGGGVLLVSTAGRPLLLSTINEDGGVALEREMDIRPLGMAIPPDEKIYPRAAILDDSDSSVWMLLTVNSLGLNESLLYHLDTDLSVVGNWTIETPGAYLDGWAGTCLARGGNGYLAVMSATGETTGGSDIRIALFFAGPAAPLGIAPYLGLLAAGVLVVAIVLVRRRKTSLS